MDHKYLRRRPSLRRALGHAGVAVMVVDNAKALPHAHSHDLVELVVVRRGRLVHEIDGVELISETGQIDCIPPGMSHRYAPIGGRVDIINLICDPHHRPELPAEIDDYADAICGTTACRGAQIQPLEHADTSELLGRMLREHDRRRPAWASALRSSYQLLLLSFARDCAAGRVRWLSTARNVHDHALSLVRIAIEDHPEKNWTLPKIAAQLGLSPEQTCRRFTSAYGRSPMAYVQHQRLLLAQSLLRRGSSVATSARAAGFPSRAALHRACTRAHGCGPREWLRTTI